MKKAILWGVVALTLLAFVGCKDDPPPPDPALKLTINGITSDATVLAAVLLKGGLAMENAVAVGINIGGDVTFVEFVPDTWLGTEPYGTLGSYYIILPTTMSETGPVYYYVGSAGTDPTEYTFTTKKATIPFSQFKLEGDSGPSLTLTVTGIPGDTTIQGAALINPQDQSPVSMGMNNNGTFTFTGASPGAYMITLVGNLLTQNPTYLYVDQQGPAVYTFTDTSPVTLMWQQFVDVSLLGGGQ
jgi:hypothetical protein